MKFCENKVGREIMQSKKTRKSKKSTTLEDFLKIKKEQLLEI